METISDKSVAAELETALLRHSDPFPYLFLVALEAGSLFRALALLMIAFPLSCFLGRRSSASFRLLLFFSTAGLPLKDIEAVARAVLPRFLAEDVSAKVWKTFSSFGSKRYVVSEWPKSFVEHFARNQLGAHEVISSELSITSSGRCLGFLKPRCRPAGINLPHLLISNNNAASKLSNQTDHYDLGDLHIVSKKGIEEAVKMSELTNPIVFHDGRLVKRPTPLMALLIFLWMPIGFVLSVLRLLIFGHCAPYRWWVTAIRMSGVKLIIRGKIPQPTRKGKGMLVVCCHRTLADPIMVSAALKTPVTAVTYSLSRVSEIIAPVRTVRLHRKADEDLKKLRGLLNEGRVVVVCPEGTTGREDLLLRFSALFAEVTDEFIPVAVRTDVGMFYGNTTRGYKAMDCFFFLMNPRPTYELVFLDRLPEEMTCGKGGKSRYDVANHVQQLIADALGFRCSSLTRRDKYRLLAGTDGSVKVSSDSPVEIPKNNRPEEDDQQNSSAHRRTESRSS